MTAFWMSPDSSRQWTFLRKNSAALSMLLILALITLCSIDGFEEPARPNLRISLER
jgi:hypothetical protein